MHQPMGGERRLPAIGLVDALGSAVRLYKDTILPAAELNAKAARTGYVTAKISALSRIEAERSLVGLRERYYEALADYFKRRATLERVVGGPLAPAEQMPRAGNAGPKDQ